MIRRLTHVLISAVCLVAFASPARAQSNGVTGFHLHSDTGVRLEPAGLRIITEGGYRVGLFDSTSRLLRDTYVDAGLSTNLSPVSVWAGPYVEALPVQVLELKASVQQMAYFGTFGYLAEVSRNAQGRFEIPELEQSNDITAGDSATGVLVRVSATPRIKVGPLVATVETTFGYINMEGVDTTYYEPILDVVFAPSDTFWQIKPTGGFMIEMGEEMGTLFSGLRLKHTASTDADFHHDVLLGVFQWTVPKHLLSWGHPKIAFAAGGWLTHSMRRGEPYIAIEVGLEWGESEGSETTDAAP